MTPRYVENKIFRIDFPSVRRRSDIAIVLKKADEPIVTVAYPPTAENLAREIFFYAKKSGFPVRQVRIWETESSMASFGE